MSEYTYTPNTGRLKEFLKKIRDIGVPTTGATQDWFQSIGFRSSNDRPILRVMRSIEFITDSSTPSDLWIQYRTPSHKKVLAEGIKRGYKDLFSIYPDANARSNQELEHFFTKRSNAGKQVIDKTILTFKTLCELADFNGEYVDQDELASDVEPPIAAISTGSKTTLSKTKLQGSGVTININIQLTLPDTTDAKVYDNFFAAMKKYLIEQ
ncbi:MAG: DUF5343 domain-containing protein [Methanoregula sp.]|nr:DUF5343 domain-containing protein [Methanoregula sp.]